DRPLRPSVRDPVDNPRDHVDPEGALDHVHHWDLHPAFLDHRRSDAADPGRNEVAMSEAGARDEAERVATRPGFTEHLAETIGAAGGGSAGFGEPGEGRGGEPRPYSVSRWRARE